MDLVGFEKEINTTYCIDLDTRDRQVTESLARIPGRLTAHVEREGKIAVVCYGPSLEETWSQLRHFDYIITVSGAHKFLIDHGIIPTWHAEVDPREHKAELIGTPHKDVEYLVASVCHRKVFDLLEGFNIKLWHVFAHESARSKIPVAYPRGDWSVTGGSNVGLRAIVLARFLGFRKITIFGMDYSFKNDGTQHAGWHPNEIPNLYAVEVGGEIFYTNPPMHQYAQQFFHEIAQIGDVDLDVVGNGLLQAQIRERVKTQPLIPTPTKPAMIAATTPQTITSEYIELNKELFKRDPAYGISGSKRADTVRKLIESTKPSTVLDYGCGRGTLAAALPFPIWEYDPCIPGKDSPPRPADLVIITDVLEHIEPDCLGNVLLDLSRCTLKVGYAVINTGPAKKVLADGRNAHLIQESSGWWKDKLEEFFNVASVVENGPEVTMILGPKAKPEKKTVAPSPDISNRITPVRHKGTEVRFHTPNQQTQWRAQSLFTKEPITIEWIDTFKPDEVFFDVGANMGGYSVWAAKRRGVKVVAFEPQADNYALLCRNLTLNACDGAAYCLALSDTITVLSTIWLSSQEAGGACNSFGTDIGPDLKPRKGIQQGCIGYRLDQIVEELGVPHHIKIDVDGLEHRVIAGAKRLLESGSIKSLLVEVNSNLPEHLAMVEYLKSIHYEFDPAQVESSTRKEGNFKGCAEYVFQRKVEPQPCYYTASKFRDAIVQKEPFPHVFIEDALEDYENLISNLPTNYTEIEKSRNVKGYPERFTAVPNHPAWIKLMESLQEGLLKDVLCRLFGVENKDLEDECLLIRDLAGYSIGPHTDSPKKVITVLFYLPKDDTDSDSGTSIYEPKETGFCCAGGPHYPANKFNLVKTMPFKPNCAFAFLKTNNSFHGVEPWNSTRDVLLYDIRIK